MTRHEKAKEVTKKVSKLLHEKMQLKKYDLLPCKTYNNHVEISIYGNKEKLSIVEKLLVDNFNMAIIPDKEYPSLKTYIIDNIHLIII